MYVQGFNAGEMSAMTGRDNHLWLQTWQDQQIEFHQESFNTFLTRFWPDLGLTRGSRIFVPLCGKSLDMIWLAQQGYNVIGVELSPIAVEDFFRENRLPAKTRQAGNFSLWQHQDISILCGDFFSLTQAELGPVDTVYDRAALTALPENIRRHYINHLKKLIPQNIDIFLLTTEDADENETMEHALGASKEIKALYAENFEINLAHVESIFETDPESADNPPIRVEYKVYRLCNKSILN